VATIIKLKRSESASSVPTTGDLAVGEVAINTADKKIYVRDSGNNIVEIANVTTTNLTSVSSNIVPGTDETYNIGSLASAFKDIFFTSNLKQQVDVYTSSGGLSTPAGQFAFRANTEKNVFTEVYTSSGGLETPAIDKTVFDDVNPAFRF
jgi:hypothetical protein